MVSLSASKDRLKKINSNGQLVKGKLIVIFLEVLGLLPSNEELLFILS